MSFEYPRTIIVASEERSDGKLKTNLVTCVIRNLSFNVVYNEDFTFIHQEYVIDKDTHVYLHNKHLNDFTNRDKGVVVSHGGIDVGFTTKNDSQKEDCVRISVISGCSITYLNVVDKTYTSNDFDIIDGKQEQLIGGKVNIIFR